MTEVFQQSQLQQVKSTWNDITTNNKFHNDNFFSRLYSNLLINDSYLSKSIFNDNEYQISQEALLFGDLFEFIIGNLDDIPLCQEFLLQFQQGNVQFINHLTKYIEPMGNAILVTLKQWIGHENVSRDLEILWIKIYCFIADEILELNSDADSTFSQEQPLQLKQSTPESDIVPAATADVVAKPPIASLENGSVISFSLDKNEKYKGFRRSVQENYTPNNEPVTITIPVSYTKPKSTMSLALSSRLSSLNEFDPRSSRRSLMSECGSSNASIMTTTDTMVTANSDEPVLTPRSSKRSLSDVPSLVKKLSERQSRFVEDSDSEEESNVASFDPRKKKHSRSNSVDYTNDLSEDIQTPTQTPKQTPKQTFDSNSFGLKGLAPIDENDFDDTDSASSKYESGDDNSSTGTNTNSEGTDIISSGASTLSLHDRSSSLSSGTEPMSSPSPDFKSQPHVRTSSGSSNISYMKPLSQPRASIPSPLSNMNSKYSRSTSSLLSEYTTTGKNRVSLGFMRSSFVLKKEMEELGFNMPENTVTQLDPPSQITVGVARLQMISPEPSVASKGSNESCLNYINAFEAGSESTLPQVGNSKFGNPQSKLELTSTLPKQKRSFSSKLKSFFGKAKPSRSKSSSSPNQSELASNTTVAESNEIPAPSSYLLRRVSTQDAAPRNDERRISQHPYASRYESIKSPSVYDTPRTSESRTARRSSRQAGKQMYSSNYSMKNRSMSDVASTGSGNSSITGFSFFGSTSNLQRTNSRTSRSTKGNKYQVKAVPYNVFARGV